MNTPYKTPEAKIESGENKTEYYSDIKKQMIIAWLVLICLYALILIPRLKDLDVDITVVSILCRILISAMAVVSLGYVRGIFILDAPQSFKKRVHLTWFGFVWRCYLSFLISIFPMAAIAYFLLGHADEFTIPRVLTSSVIDLFSVLFINWVFYSIDRKGQVKQLLSLVRGW